MLEAYADGDKCLGGNDIGRNGVGVSIIGTRSCRKRVRCVIG